MSVGPNLVILLAVLIGYMAFVASFNQTCTASVVGVGTTDTSVQIWMWSQ